MKADGPKHRARGGGGLSLHLKVRGHLIAGGLAGLLAYIALWYVGLSAALRVALSWDFGIGLYLLLSWTMMQRSKTEHIERRARTLDISLWEIAGLTVLAAAFSLIAAVRVMGEADTQTGAASSIFMVAGIATIILSWFFVHTLFAIHYAHEFHDEDKAHVGKAQGGLNFPGEQQPDYWDFVYFAAVVAMTSQVSDVTTVSREMRHLVTVHGVISFFLNTVIVALAVGVAAGLI